MQEPSDGALLEAFRGGDAASFSTLVARHQAVLLRHARSILGAAGAWEDAVQEAFLTLVERPPVVPRDVRGNGVLERAHLLSWLHTVTRNCCMDYLRKETRRRTRETLASRSEVAAPGDAFGGDPSMEEHETLKAVERGLEQLSVDQREVLMLRLMGDRSYREIAEITGKKIGTVGWLISAGIKSLEERLAPLLDRADTAALARASAQRTSLRMAQGEQS